MNDKPMNSPYSRRQLLGGGVKLAGLAFAASVLSPKMLSKAYANETLTVLISQPQVGAAELMAKAFKEATGVNLQIVPVPLDQVQQQLTLDKQSGAHRFDAFDFWYISKGALVEDKILMDLTDHIARDQKVIQPDDFIPAIYDPYSLYNGRRYSLPFDGDTHALFYNTEILERNGVKPPTTWDEVVQAAIKITEAENSKGIYGIALMGVRVPLMNISVFANRLANYGGEFLDKDGKPALNSEAAIAAAKNLVATIPGAVPTPVETGFEEALTAFVGGRAAMTEGWIDLGVYAEDKSKSRIAGKWDVVPLPVGGGVTKSRAPLNAGWALGVADYSTKKELAWELIKFGSTAQMGEKYITTTGTGVDPFRISNMNSENYKSFNPKAQRAAASSLNGAVAWPTVPQTPRLLEALSDQLAAMMAGNKSPADAMEQAQRAWTRLLR
ncbi:ABC transporter substrate-binding protein [Microvirga sp. GCM10011540]|uniref:ABC transporter substrate-binding protein n=1 Tax=Microvirga sp. GCM10011540 TaxID=3317338 RepID=UPI00360A24B3